MQAELWFIFFLVCFNPELLFKAITNWKGEIYWLASISNACLTNPTTKYLIHVIFKYFRNCPFMHCHKWKHGAFRGPWVYCKCTTKFPGEYSWLSGIFLQHASNRICLVLYIDILLKPYISFCRVQHKDEMTALIMDLPYYFGPILFKILKKYLLQSRTSIVCISILDL